MAGPGRGHGRRRARDVPRERPAARRDGCSVGYRSRLHRDPPESVGSYPIDLSRLAGQSVTLSFELRSETPGALGFWGAPVIRALGGRPQTARPAATGDGTPPHGCHHHAGRHAAPGSLEFLRAFA